MRNKYTIEQIEKIVENVAVYHQTVGQRFGQFFYNMYDFSGEPFPELFNTASIKEAINLIYANYLHKEDMF